MSSLMAGSYIYLHAKGVTDAGLKNFIRFQNSVFSRGAHLLFFEPLSVASLEEGFLIAVSVNGGFLGIIPLLDLIPKSIAYLSLLASFKLQHKNKGRLWWVTSSLPAYLSVHSGVFK